MTERQRPIIGLAPVPSLPSGAFQIVEIDAVIDAPRSLQTDVLIAGAMLQGSKHVSRYAWVSLLNLTAGPIDLGGWTLENASGATVALRGAVEPGHAIALRDAALLALRPSTDGDVLTLRHGDRIVDRARFRAEDLRDGRAVIFRGDDDPHPLADPRGG